MALSPGLYFIVTTVGGSNAGWCVDLPAQDDEKPTGHVQKMFPNASHNQKWLFELDPDRPGRFNIRWVSGGGNHRLQPKNGSNDSRAEIQFAPRANTGHQAWVVQDAGGGLFQILNDGSGLAMDFYDTEPKAGDRIRQFNPNNSAAQKWVLQSTSP